MDARISALSLTYYGLCMLNGNYTVNLHFAEIFLTDDRTFNSLARRIFDIYIQGLLVVKDFNIEDEAGGVNKPIIKSFRAEVLDNTLEMQFYWAGKGTMGFPFGGYYGPLISAISVEPSHFIPPSEHPPLERRKGLSAWAIVGIVIAVIFSISLLLAVLCWNRCFKCKDRMEQGPEERQLKLDWPTRHNICIGIARGLGYLHEESRMKIVHRDIKATNVLLDMNLNPKISDFGLARLHEEEDSRISTRIAGTIGYMAPEYASSGYLTDKADVYSFGIVLLEIVSGKSCTSKIPKDDCFCVLDWARLLKQEGRLMELVDSRLGSDFDSEEVMLTIDIALLCTHTSPNVRPSMSTVVGTLEGRVDRKLISKSILSSESFPTDMATNHKLMTDLNESQGTSMLTDASGTASSKSVSDIYPISLATHLCETENRDDSRLMV